MCLKDDARKDIYIHKNTSWDKKEYIMTIGRLLT